MLSCRDLGDIIDRNVACLESGRQTEFQIPVLCCGKGEPGARPRKLKRSCETPDLQPQPSRAHRHSQQASLPKESLAQAAESVQSQHQRLREARYLGHLVAAEVPTWGEVSEGK